MFSILEGHVFMSSATGSHLLGGTVGVHPNACQIDESCFSHKPKVTIFFLTETRA